MHRSTRLSRRAGQALIEYAILLVLLTSITIGVIFLAGDQLGVAFNDVSYDIGHASDPAPATVAPHTCPDGTTAVQRHNKWRCKHE
jgi:Flp pilus assembly pilin Flp